MKYLVIVLYDSEGVHVSSYKVQHQIVVFQDQSKLDKWLNICIQIMAENEDWNNLNQVMFGDTEFSIGGEYDSNIIKIRKTRSILEYYHPVFGENFDVTLDFRDREPAFRILGYVQKEG